MIVETHFYIAPFFLIPTLVKLPFPLTPRFKQMLQSGVDTRDMDVTWVSSLSWYFLNLFGLGSVFSLILGDNNGKEINVRKITVFLINNVAAGVDMTAMSAMPGMMPGAMPGMGQPGQPQDFNKLFLAEKENIMITPHVWDLEDVEDRLLRKYGKTVLTKKIEAKKPSTVRDKIKASQKSSNSGTKRR